MKSTSPRLKKKIQKSNNSTIPSEKPQKYLGKNISKKYVYKKEKAADTDKVLENNKLSKNYIFSPVHTKKDNSLSQTITNNIKSELRRPLERREDANIDYEKYHQQTFHIKHHSIGSFNYITNNLPTSPIINQDYYLLERKNSYMDNTNRSVTNLITKWKCPNCNNVNSNFNYLCNNCNLPNTSLANPTLDINQRTNSAGKNLRTLNIDNTNIINNSYNNIKSNNNFILKKQILKKHNTNKNFNTNNNNTISSQYYNNIEFNTIRPNNKINTNYFYNDPINNSINNTANNYLFGAEMDNSNLNINLNSYIENEQNNDNEYFNDIYEQNDLIKKKIKVLKEKENQLDKINDQLQKSLLFIKNKFGYNKNNNCLDLMDSFNENKLDEINMKINKYKEENEKLSKKLKENQNIIKGMKIKIEELSEEKNSDANIRLKNKIEEIIKIKNNIEKYTKEIKEQNKICL